MKIWKETLSVGLSLVMCASLVAPSFAATFKDLQGVIDNKTSYTYEQDGETVTGISYDTDTDTVKLYEKVEYKSGDPSTITIKKDTNVTLDLNGNAINAQDKTRSSVITINEGGKLTLTDSTAFEKNEDGAFVLDENGKKVRRVDEDGNAVAGEGSITGGTGQIDKWIWRGGGVYIAKDATFTMEGGTIVDNDGADYGGGVYNQGTFNMTGGTIADNSASSDGYFGGGVYNASSGTFNMEGGTIASNYAGDVYWAGYGGGVTNYGTFNMTGGTIEDNGADYGGGVYNRGTFNMTGGTIADNDTGWDNWAAGGGVYNLGPFNMEGGTITGNTAITGGGVYNCDSFTMTGGTLEGNTADRAGDEIYNSDKYGHGCRLNLPEDLLWDQDNESDRENGVEKVYGAADLKSISTETGLKHHEHNFIDVTTEPTCTKPGEKESKCICGLTTTEEISALGHDMHDEDWVVTTLAGPGVAGEETRVCRREGCDYTETRPIPALPVPAPAPVTDPTTEIEDVDVPLSGIFTRADAIGYLWEQSGSPEWKLSDFPDVPEDHQWAVAIGWAEDMGIALPDQDGNFRPDDPVLRYVEDLEIDPEGEFEEFLNRYAVYAGVELEDGELFYRLGGVADDIVMGEEAQEIFDSFFAKLNAALSQAA